MRINRKNDELRTITIEPNFNKHAEGSCLIKWGDNQIICTATIEEKTPPFLKNTGTGWVTAEYSMIPRSTDSRMQRDITKGKINGRASEIQRLIGRSLRSAVNLEKLGEKQIIIDCDVIQADGGTRCASITGGFVALSLAVQKGLKTGLLNRNPIVRNIAAVSTGIVGGAKLLDLDYKEDSSCEVDMNFIMNDEGNIIEIQGTGERAVFSINDMNEMYNIASVGIKKIIELQNSILK